MKILHTVGRGSDLRTTPSTSRYYVEFYTQPWYNRVHQWAYHHLYDNVVHKVPGYKVIEKVMDAHLDRKAFKAGPVKVFRTGEEGYTLEPGMGLPWFAERDCQCYFLSQRGRVDLGRVNLTYEQYLKIRGKTWQRIDDREEALRASQQQREELPPS